MSYTAKEVLRLQVAPALGCTEPVAIALASAAAASLLKEGEIDALDIWVDPNIYKNGMAVAIPGTPGLSGLDRAGALGALAGDPALKLEVLAPIGDSAVRSAEKLVIQKKVKVHLLEDHKGLYIKACVTQGDQRATAIVRDMHDNIAALELNGEAINRHPLLARGDNEQAQGGLAGLETWLKRLSLGQLLDLVDQLDDKDLAFIEEGITYNMRLAEYGLKHGPGLGVGKALDRLVRQRIIRKDMIQAARIMTSAAADARMAGAKLPAMSSAGSGNHGLTAILPLCAVFDYVDCDRSTLLRAVGLSHIITAYIKAHTGRLSAVCGCSIAAGAGVSAGVAYLMSGSISHIAGAIKNVAEDLAGVICDGAKSGCALKLATAAGTAVQAALFSLQGVNVQSTDGIIDQSPEQTMQNLGTLSTQGMIETDRTILKIMMEKQFSDY
ncbi:MAG: L-serine ammonia-lyase, iron-sulfur-dependent, subunit alpha [Desulfobacteraceae bacterium]|jgi:L-cysteine desulfidase